MFHRRAPHLRGFALLGKASSPVIESQTDTEKEPSNITLLQTWEREYEAASSKAIKKRDTIMAQSHYNRIMVILEIQEQLQNITENQMFLVFLINHS